MDVRALILVGAAPEISGTSSGPELAVMPPGSQPEHIAGVPIALLDVVGRPVVQHLVAQLRQAGVHAVSVVSETGPEAAPFLRRAQRPDLPWRQGTDGDVWRSCIQSFIDMAQSGAEIVLVFRLGPYTEMNFDELIQFHLDQRARVTCVRAPQGLGAGVFVISASRRNDAAYLFRHRLEECRVPAAEFIYGGYLNRLRNARDLRQLTLDALYGDIALEPAGRQIKPGVWVEDGARIHPRARVLAPAFVGQRARIRAAAVVTRGSSIEHHGVVDCGSVVDDGTVLPFSYVGPGLDVSHAVVGFRRLAHLRRNVEVAIEDPKLVSMITASAPVRAISGAAGLAAFLPVQLFRGMFAKSHRRQPAELPESVHAPAAALQEPAAHGPREEEHPDAHKFPADLMIARRYGNE